MGEVVEQTLSETTQKVIADNNLRPAGEPDLKPEGDLKAVIDGKADLAYELALDLMPEFTPVDAATLELKRPVYEPTDAEVDEAVAELAKQNRTYEPRTGKTVKAKDGDQVVIDFIGRVDGEAFEGGTATDVELVLGSGQFIPGFEEQLIGIKAGEKRMVQASFPPNYLKVELAGKEASFDVTAKSIDAPGELTINDDFAKQLGLESLAKLRDAVKDRIAREHAGASRNRLKRQLLDALDERHKFELPPTLLTQEFDNVWQTVEGDLKQQGRTFADEGTTEEEARAEYRKIAERRVRLGLVIAEIGDKNQIKVTDEEMQRAVVDRARQFPGQEQQVWEFYRNNPQAVASLRAPIYEEKVVDFLTELTKVTDKKVTREELYKEDETDQPAEKAV
jgi:trigger factor